MSNLVEITDPNTGEKFMVHPWIAEHGEWFPPFDGSPETRKAFQAMLPGRKLLLQDLAQIALVPPVSEIHSTPSSIRIDAAAKNG